MKDDFFSGAADSVTHSLSPLGYDVRDYAFNAKSIQLAWAQENGVRRSSRRWDLEIARSQVRTHSPDILMLNPFSVPAKWLEELRQDFPCIKVLVARHSSPRPDLSPFGRCEVVLSGDRQQVDELRRLGINGVHLHHAFDQRILDHVKVPGTPKDVVLFTGSINLRPGFHSRRLQLLQSLIEAGVDIELRALISAAKTGGMRGRLLNAVTGSSKGAEWADQQLAGAEVDPPAFGIDMFIRMRQTAVTFNSHGEVSTQDANNIRMWEAPGIGTCLLTDHKPNIPEFFDADREIVTYVTEEDCVEKAQWLLNHRKEREAIAEAGQRRILSDHTFMSRAPELDAAIRQALDRQRKERSL